MCIQFVTLPLHFLLVAYLNDRYQIYGIAMATNISFTLNFLALHTYISFITREPYKINYKIRGSLVVVMKEYVKLGIPSVLMTYFDFWIYTILLFVSTKMGVI